MKDYCDARSKTRKNDDNTIRQHNKKSCGASNALNRYGGTYWKKAIAYISLPNRCATADATLVFLTMAASVSSTTVVPTQEVPPVPIYVDTQHEDLVHDAQLDYYGCKLATCSSGRLVLMRSRRLVVPFILTPCHCFLDRPHCEDLQCI